MSFSSNSDYFAHRAAMSRAASSAAVDPAIAYAHRVLAIRYEAECDLITYEEGSTERYEATASHAKSAI